VGLVCSDGVVLAAEKRVSWGRMVMSRSGKKVFGVTPTMGLAFAAVARDVVSGDGVDMLVIRADGTEERSFPMRS